MPLNIQGVSLRPNSTLLAIYTGLVLIIAVIGMTVVIYLSVIISHTKSRDEYLLIQIKRNLDESQVKHPVAPQREPLSA